MNNLLTHQKKPKQPTVWLPIPGCKSNQKGQGMTHGP